MNIVVGAVSQYVVKHLMRGLKAQTGQPITTRYLHLRQFANTITVANMGDLSQRTQDTLKKVVPWLSPSKGLTCEHPARAIIAGHMLLYFDSPSLTPSFFPAISLTNILNSYQA